LSIIAYLLFFLAGLGFGYAAPGRLKWIALAFPVLLFIVAVLTSGLDLWGVVKLLIALLIAAAGIIVGRMLDERGREGEAPAT
jgi:hypothetical protein